MNTFLPNLWTLHEDKTDGIMSAQRKVSSWVEHGGRTFVIKHIQFV
jgi:hypothetical protein